MGQTILEIGPAWHKSKEGTPTMGGIIFFFAVSLSSMLGCLFLAPWESRRLLWVLAFALLNGLIGVFDDVQKLRKKENAGLLPWQKLILQSLTVVLLFAALRAENALETSLSFPFFQGGFELGPFYYPLVAFISVGIINCANLTDGVDGLAAAVAATIGAFFAAEGIRAEKVAFSVLGAAEAGCALGFFAYNRHPARIFMGDSGSLFLGAMAVGGGFLTGNPFLVLFFGFLYVLEGFSVVLQVVWYKATKKRLFKMAPFHHHLEKCGWSEGAIVSVFTFFTLLTVLLSHLFFYS